MLQVVACVFVAKRACVMGRCKVPFSNVFGAGGVWDLASRPCKLCTPNLSHSGPSTWYMFAMNNEDRGLGCSGPCKVRVKVG